MRTDGLDEWIAALEAAYPTRHAQQWDSVGLQVGDPHDRVSAALVALDVTAAVLAEARDRGADLVIAHHPLLFRPLARVTPATPAGALALDAARSGIAVFAAHTNFDAAVPGTSDPVLAVLDVQPVATLAPLEGEPGLGIGRVGTLPAPLALGVLADRLAVGLPSPHLRVAGQLDRPITRIAACGGAGDTMVGAALDAGADVLVTGDLRHHVVLDALQQGLAMIDAGHHATEAAALPALHDRVAAEIAARGLVARLLASTRRTDPWASYCPHRPAEEHA